MFPSLQKMLLKPTMAQEIEKDALNRAEALHNTWGRGLRSRKEERVLDDLMWRHYESKDTVEKSGGEGRPLTRRVFQRRDAPIWSLYACVVCVDENRLCPDHQFVLYDELTGVTGYVAHVVAEGRYDEPVVPLDGIPLQSRRANSRLSISDH